MPQNWKNLNGLMQMEKILNLYNYLILKESLLFCIVFKVGVLAVIK